VIATLKNYVKQHFFRPAVTEKGPVDAYDIWAANYDKQPGNLMLDLDEIVFTRLLAKSIINNKDVADIGCGTGRHWPKVFNHKPKSLTGFDVSAGMLNKLEEKFPDAQTYQVTGDLFTDIPSQSYDTIISTLTVAHIPHIEAALQAWCRILKNNADIIITDFHPSTLAYGGKRTFKHKNTSIAIENYVHLIATIKDVLMKNKFEIVAQEEMEIDESVKHYYTDKNALHVYNSYKGFPIIYGMHLRRQHDIE
jgi:ubiquinone/menaquinone biosynthesis C-methylase UbiE